MRWIFLLLLSVACTHIVTEPWPDTDAVDVAVSDGAVDTPDDVGAELPDGVADVQPDLGSDTIEPTGTCEPSCPDGWDCYDGVCRDPATSTVHCGWYLPGQTAQGELCKVPDGFYTIGCTTDSPTCKTPSQPAVRVHLTRDTFVDRFEVSNHDYGAYIVGNEGAIASPECSDAAKNLWEPGASAPKDASLSSHPVVCVNAEQAGSYCKWQGKRLPSEAEWEAAARGALDGPYPWGAFDAAAAACLFKDDSVQTDDECRPVMPQGTCPDMNPSTRCVETVPVSLAGACSLPTGESPFGLCHAAGNAAEWTADGWVADHAGLTPDQVDPSQTPIIGGDRAVRGGSWYSEPARVTVWWREGRSDDERQRTLGFRCAFTRPE
jgi:formylglycine-generating enzyme required for sulfatase activity